MLTEADFHDYQVDAIRWMSARTWGKLWLGLGLGKTVIALTAIQEMWRRYGFERALIVAPKRVARLTWGQELDGWEHLCRIPYEIAVGTAKERTASFKLKAPITITNYDNLAWMYKQGFELPEIIIFDELARLKNPRAGRVLAHVPFKHRYKRLFGMTATPAAENYLGLWAQEEVLTLKRNPIGRNITQFRDIYCDFRILPNGGRVYSVRQEMRETIREKIAPTTLVMNAEDYVSIEESHFRIHTLPWEDAFIRDMYDELEQKFFIELRDNPIEALNKGVALNKLRQFCGGSIYDNDGKYHRVHDYKLDYLEEIMEALNGDPTLICYEYKFERDLIMDRFRGQRGTGRNPMRVASFHAGMSYEKERDILQQWNDGQLHALVIHPASAGEGLNLQKPCCNSIWYTLPWSLERYLQTNGRIARQGQTRPTVFHLLMMEGSVDQLVWSKLNGKLAGMQDLLAAIKSWRPNIAN